MASRLDDPIPFPPIGQNPTRREDAQRRAVLDAAESLRRQQEQERTAARAVNHRIYYDAAASAAVKRHGWVEARLRGEEERPSTLFRKQNKSAYKIGTVLSACLHNPDHRHPRLIDYFHREYTPSAYGSLYSKPRKMVRLTSLQNSNLSVWELRRRELSQEHANGSSPFILLSQPLR